MCRYVTCNRWVQASLMNGLCKLQNLLTTVLDAFLDCNFSKGKERTLHHLNPIKTVYVVICSIEVVKSISYLSWSFLFYLLCRFSNLRLFFLFQNPLKLIQCILDYFLLVNIKYYCWLPTSSNYAPGLLLVH